MSKREESFNERHQRERKEQLKREEGKVWLRLFASTLSRAGAKYVDVAAQTADKALIEFKKRYPAGE